jgi:hypothetical protein
VCSCVDQSRLPPRDAGSGRIEPDQVPGKQGASRPGSTVRGSEIRSVYRLPRQRRTKGLVKPALAQRTNSQSVIEADPRHTNRHEPLVRRELIGEDLGHLIQHGLGAGVVAGRQEEVI